MKLCRIVEFSKENLHEFVDVMVDAIARGRKSSDPELVKAVSKICAAVRKGGWKAALRFTRKFDASDLKASQFEVSKREFKSAEIPNHQHDAILKSIERVTSFHNAQLSALTKGWNRISLARDKVGWEWSIPVGDSLNSGTEGQRLLSLRGAGLYVPGGKGSYPSSVIMNAVPAKVAGVEFFMMCTPPRSDGTIDPAVIVAARELGIETVVKCGGAQAIALMAYGPAGERESHRFLSWPAVDKIVGPGNKWVNEAKRLLSGVVGFDCFAGPSEVCVVADETANPAFAAADWLTQIEHAEDNAGFLFATSRATADRILSEAEQQLKNSPRADVIKRSLESNGLVIVMDRPFSYPLAADSLAAEHVSLMVSNAESAATAIQDSGCLALGDYTPQSAGDFCAGPSHTLPTGGAARFSSPLNVMDFLKFQSISRFTKEDLAELLPTIEAFGEMEGFPQHARAARIRFEG